MTVYVDEIKDWTNTSQRRRLVPCDDCSRAENCPPCVNSDEAVIKAQMEEIPSPAVRAKAAEYLKELHDGMRDFRF